jgi:nitrite reductase (NO-forming)
MMKISGSEDKAIYSGKEVDEVYLGSQGQAGQDVTKLKSEYEQAIEKDPTLQKLSKDILVAEGKNVFTNNCSMCHQPNGEGVPAVFPPLAKSDFLMKLAKADSRDELIAIPINGKTGKITVNGSDYNLVMPPMSALSDADIAAVLTYVTSSWGNSGVKPFSLDEVKRGRAALADQQANGAHK